VFIIGRNAKLNGNYLTAYSTLRDIVTYNYDTSFSFDGMDNIRTSEFRVWMDVIMYTYSEMVQCINEAYAAGHIDSTYDFSDIIQIQNNLMNKSSAIMHIALYFISTGRCSSDWWVNAAMH
jgi:hypothetical protein